MDRDRQTATLNNEMPTAWETKPQTAGPKQVKRPKTLQAMLMTMMMVIIIIIIIIIIVLKGCKIQEW